MIAASTLFPRILYPFTPAMVKRTLTIDCSALTIGFWDELHVHLIHVYVITRIIVQELFL